MRPLASAATVFSLFALTSAVQEPLQQYVQGIVGQIGSYVPKPNRFNAEDAAAARHGPKQLSVLTVDNWKEVLSEPVGADATSEPVQWWVLVTGLNKTCYGNCGQVEAAFNETAEKLGERASATHLAIVNCDYQPILCGSWGATTGSIWLIEMKPLPATIDIYTKRLNLTSTSSKDIITLLDSGTKTSLTPLKSFWHPYNSNVAKLGLATPLAYILWIPSLFPQWTWMLLISLISRRMLSRRTPGPPVPPPAEDAPRRAGPARPAS